MMTNELIDTLKLINARLQESGTVSVDIPLVDFPWYSRQNRQLTRLYEEGFILKPFFSDNYAKLQLSTEGIQYLESLTTSSEAPEKALPTVFISYNWGSSSTADQIERKLSGMATLQRDIHSLGSWDGLPEFMESIRVQDFAVLIVSDSYLKSVACLYEVMELMKDADWDKRVMYVVEDDARSIYQIDGQLGYVEYWDKQAKSLEEKLKPFDPSSIVPQSQELKKIKMIRLTIGTFISKVASVNNPSVSDSIDAIAKRVTTTN